MKVSTWVKHDRLDDEVMVIDLESGAYFAFVGAAADAWSLLAAGQDVATVGAAIGDRYDVDAAADLVVFVADLVGEGLLVHGVTDDTAPDLGAPTVSYEAPRIERFDDLADLLLLDPVHEVDATGWPAGRAE